MKHKMQMVPRWYPKSEKEEIEYYKYPRVYFVIVGETPVQNLTARFERPWQVWQETIIPEIYVELNLPADIECVWDQNAGSKAGADPGFILKVPAAKFDVWVHIYPDEK